MSYTPVVGALSPATPTVSTTITSLTLTSLAVNSWVTSAVILFDQGSTITGSTLTVGGNSATLTYFTSESVDYMYQTAYAIFTNTSSNATWVLGGFKTPYFYSGDEVIVVIGSQGFSSTPVCPFSSSVPYSHSPGTLSFVKVSPTTSVAALGATNQVFNTTLTLTTSGSVKGSSLSSINVILASNFTKFSGATYKVTLGTFTDTGRISGTTFNTNPITSTQSAGTLTINIYNLPLPDPALGTTAFAVITYVTVKYGGKYVYCYNQTTITNPSSAYTTFTAGVAAGSVQSASALVFPNTIGVTEAYLQVKFTTPVFLPQGTVLTYTSNATLIYPDNNIKSNTWFTGGFTSVSLTSSYTIVVTTRSPIAAGALVELRKDQALPVTSGQYGVSFTILATITVGGTTTNLINDIYGVNVTFNSTPSGTISSPAVTLSVTNQGEISDYNFTFTYSSNLTVGSSILIDVPSVYDAHFGPAYTFNSAPTVFYLESSSTLGVSTCLVDHWVITCSFNNAVNSGQINLAIQGFVPPQSSTGNFFIYIVDPSGTFQAVYQTAELSASTTKIPDPKADIYWVQADRRNTDTATYTFVAEITETYSANGGVFVVFPQQYNLEVYQLPTVACSATYNGGPLSALVTPCNVTGTALTYQFSGPTTLSSANKVSFVAQSIANPVNGTKRTPEDDIYMDATDKSIFTLYSFYTGKFQLYTSATTSLSATSISFSSKSYFNLNAAYTGFFPSITQKLVFNGGVNVAVIPGTTSLPSTLTATGGILQAKKLVVRPGSDLSGWGFDKSSYNLTQTFPTAQFSVGTAATTPFGVYHLTWTVEETPLNSGIFLYSQSIFSYFEVLSTGLVSITRAGGSDVAPLGTSLPHTLTIANGLSVFSSLKVTPYISVGDSSSFTFNPPTLTFTPGVNSLSFVVVTTLANSTATYTLSFNNSGSDAAAYNSISKTTFKVQKPNSYAASISALVLTVVDSVTFTASINANTTGVLTWALATPSQFTSNSVLQSYTSLSAVVAPLYGTPTASQYTLAQQVESYKKSIQAIKDSGADSTSQTISLLNLVDTVYFASQTNLAVANSLINIGSTLNFLAGGTKYTLFVWLDNYSGLLGTKSASGKTPDIPPPAIVSITSSRAPTASEKTYIIGAISILTGFPTSRITPYVGASRRRLDITTSFVVAGDPVSSVDVVSLVSGVVTVSSLTSTFTQNYPATDLTVTGVSAIAAVGANFPAPAWTGFLSLSYSYYKVYLNATSAISGTIYCVTEFTPSNSSTITATQVFRGLSRSGSSAYTFVNTTVTNGTYVSFLINTYSSSSTYGSYVTTCNLCNYYVPVPQCLADNVLVQIRYYYSFIQVILNGGVNVTVIPGTTSIPINITVPNNILQAYKLVISPQVSVPV